MCNFCPVFARHPCTSREEAARCGNCPNRGSYLDFNAREVAEWIRDQTDDPDLLIAAKLIEDRM